jgi:hypothetical protein
MNRGAEEQGSPWHTVAVVGARSDDRRRAEVGKESGMTHGSRGSCFGGQGEERLTRTRLSTVEGFVRREAMWS